jgi:hypothetical protein
MIIKRHPSNRQFFNHFFCIFSALPRVYVGLHPTSFPYGEIVHKMPGKRFVK